MSWKVLFLLRLFCLAVFVSGQSLAALDPSKTFESEGTKLKLSHIWKGEDVIWSLCFLPTGEVLFAERAGKFRVLDPKTGIAKGIEGAPKVAETGQGGLLDVALHPDFNKNSLIYFTYSKTVEGGYTTALGRGKLDIAKARVSDIQELFLAAPGNRNTHHFGSRLAFDDSGHLFMTVGDRGERDWAQRLDTHAGKVLRLTGDGKPAPGNPFDMKTAKPEIWSYGHRNLQGLAWDPKRKILWQHEHGPRGGDEINLVKKGANYGWPVVTYGREYYGPKIGEGTEKKGIEPPFKYYVPSIAPSGLAVYDSQLLPKWQGSLISGALVLTHLNRVPITNSSTGSAANVTGFPSDNFAPGKEERLFVEMGKRIRDVRTSSSGEVYFSTDDGRIYRIHY